jgi:hypothetical protein
MTSDGFAHLRIEYGDEPLRRDELPADPFELFRSWLAAAAAAGVSEPNGMTLATVDAEGQPHCRVVLLKELDRRGLTFFTNKQSDKGGQLAANARAAINFWWPAPRNRQVRLLGTVEHVEAEPRGGWPRRTRAHGGRADGARRRRRSAASCALGRLPPAARVDRVLAGAQRAPARSLPLPRRGRRMADRAAGAVTAGAHGTAKCALPPPLRAP